MASEASPHPPTQPTGEVSVSLARELGLFDLTMMGVGMMIGAGAVLGMGISVHIAGPGGTLVAFLLDGVLALLTGMAYAEMASAIPRAGSIYNFARIGMGRTTGFMAGWIAWFASAVGGSLYAALFGIYTVHYLAQLGLLGWVPLPAIVQERAVSVLVAALFVYVNYRGVSETGKAQNLLTLGQTVALALVAAVGIIVAIVEPARLANFEPFLPNGWAGVLVCMGFEFVAFEGFEVVATAGDEAIEPRRNLPRAILYSVLIVTVTYLAVGFALIVGIGDVGMPAWQWLGMQGEGGFGAALAELMPLGGLVATLTVIFASTSAMNATIYCAARASYALGRDGMLPGAFGRISARRRTPHVALLFTGIIVLAMAAFLPIIDVASSASIMFLFMFLVANLCVIRIRRRMADELTYGFRVPLFPLLPVVAIALQVVLAIYIVDVSWVAWVAAPAWIGAGAIVYLAYARSHARPIREEILTLEERPAPPAEGGGLPQAPGPKAGPSASGRPAAARILVPVGNPANALRMVRQVARLAEADRASVDLLHMVTIPDQVPLSDAPLYAHEGQEAIAEATLYLAHRFPVSSSVRYCRNVARGILAESRQRRTDEIVLGWPGRAGARDFAPGTTVGAVLDRAPCRVVVFRDAGKARCQHILVPLVGNPNDLAALAVASSLVARDQGRITVLQAVAPGRPARDFDAFLVEAAPRLRCPRDLIESQVVETRREAQAIVDAAAGCDFVVLGVSEQPWWRRPVARGLTEQVAALTDRPLAIVRARGRIRSFLARWV